MTTNCDSDAFGMQAEDAAAEAMPSPAERAAQGILLLRMIKRYQDALIAGRWAEPVLEAVAPLNVSGDE